MEVFRCRSGLLSWPVKKPGFQRVNSDEAVSSTNRVKTFISKAFYGLLNSLKAAAIKVVELIFEALVYLLNRSKRNSSKAASQAFYSREQEDNGMQMEEIV